jgi:Domain of Unknown Function (DUF930)
MRRLPLTIGVIWIAALPVCAGRAAGGEGPFLRGLRLLAPVDRLVQLCDYTAMRRIGKEHRKYRPDRAVAGARADSVIDSHTIVAADGAFRSRGKWYALSYTCTAAPDHLKVLSFKYEIGKAIPQDKWAAFGLWQ